MVNTGRTERWAVRLLFLFLLVHNELAECHALSAQDREGVAEKEKTAKVNWWVMVRFAFGLLRMSLTCFWLQLDVARRNKDPVFLEIASQVKSPPAQPGPLHPSSFLEMATTLSAHPDKCDIDIDPILIRLDWQEFYVEVVYLVMEKYVRKMREEAAAQKESYAPLFQVGPDTSPAEALALLRVAVRKDPSAFQNPNMLRSDSGQEREAEPEDSMLSQAHLMRQAVHSIPPSAKRSPSNQLPLGPDRSTDEHLLHLSPHKDPLGPNAVVHHILSMLEVHTGTRTADFMEAIARWITLILLWIANILMWIAQIICYKKDDKVGASLLEIATFTTTNTSVLDTLERIDVEAHRPSSPEMESPDRTDVGWAERVACPHPENCDYGDSWQTLEYHKNYMVSMEKRANDMGVTAKHLPMPRGIRRDENTVIEHFWTPSTTTKVMNHIRASREGHHRTGIGSRPMPPLGTTNDCNAFFRKAIWLHIVEGWMHWWATYYTIIYWHKTNTENVD